MKKEEFIQLLGKRSGSFNLGLILYKDDSELEENVKLFPDSNQVSIFGVSSEFDSLAIQSIFNALQEDRIVKVIVDKEINSDFFMFISYLSKYSMLKFNQKEVEPNTKAKMVVCMKEYEYHSSKYELGHIFYPILI